VDLGQRVGIKLSRALEQRNFILHGGDLSAVFGTSAALR
jgi:hypothetical protein